ncbi:MAG: hypothetical protein HWN81_14780 [Candidatus Lokiarchaeota archaeon]|nr:hypothetical protein [Candidatus Lokiarchaeota archaeon]
MRNIKKMGYLLLLILISAAVFQVLNFKNHENSTAAFDEGKIHTSALVTDSRQWIIDGDFSSSDNWILSKSTLGDSDDVDAIISEGTANFTVNGESRRYSFEGVPNSTWTAFNNSEWGVGMDEGTERGISDIYGCWVSYNWSEQLDELGNTPSVHWKRNITLPVDMSDYKITSAFLNVTFNATVQVDPLQGGIDVIDDSPSQIQSGDYARFYVLISDIKNVYQPFQIANNRTKYLGWDDGSVSTIYTTSLKNIDENLLINYLELILGVNSTTFTMTLGIDLYCEDNTGTDVDNWEKLRINFLNLSFSYERKINQLTTVSLNQNGAKPSDISSDTVVVDEAILNFKYMINDTWSNLSSNSEIQVLINGFKHTESINLLDDAKTYVQDAKSNGFDVTYLIQEEQNINLSIQVYIADDFQLNRTIMISIDNVSLNVSYTILFEDYHTNLHLFLNGENKTLTPSIELPLDKNLTITVNYLDQTGTHISGADIQLTGVGIIEDLKEYANNYSITINATQKLSMGVNYLEIAAKKTNYETKIFNPTINIRKIIGEIKTISGDSTLDINVGENLQLEIVLNDTDNNKLITDAIVTYTWDLDSIPRVLTENNGIYAGEIENPPEGHYSILISVFAGNDYEFEDLTLTLNVETETLGAQPNLGWLIYVLTGAIIGLVVIFTLYQTHFKFPPMVRKIRKLKKLIRKDKTSKSVLVKKRDDYINRINQDQINNITTESIHPKKDLMIEKMSLDKDEN